MKLKIIFFLLLTINQIIAQTKPEFDKVIFRFLSEHAFGKNKGEFSTYEEIEFAGVNGSKYKMTRNQNIRKIFNGEKVLTKTDSFKIIRSITQNEISLLLNLLNNNQNNYTFDFIKPKLYKPKRELIRKIMNWHSKVWKYEQKKITETQLKIIESDIRNFQFFNEFIEFEKPKKDALYGRLDSSDYLNINFISKNDTIVYNFESYHKCGQPFIKEGDKYKTNIVNLNVNKLIENILPKNSLFVLQFNIQNITEKYIHWYLQNKT
jgi:hypothetical protein